MAQLKDLIVTGAARFLNNIYGNLKGNADTASKVNHKITITTNQGTVEFDGSSDGSVTINHESLQIRNMMRLIGIVDQRYTQFSDIDGNGNYVSSDLTITVGNHQDHVIFLSTALVEDSGAVTAQLASDNSTVLYYLPKKGDLVLQDDEEYLCVDVTSTSSLWRATNSPGYWARF